VSNRLDPEPGSECAEGSCQGIDYAFLRALDGHGT
jgi:hypothetical protein